MGDVGQTFFGGSNNQNTSTSSSSNLAYPYLSGQLAPAVTALPQGTSFLGSLLGIPGYTAGGGTPAGTPSQAGSGSYTGPTLNQINAMRHDGIAGDYHPALAAYQAAQNGGTSTSIPTPTSTTPPAGGSPQSALQDFSDSGGMKFLEDNGNRMIDNNAAAKGLAQSGATLKGIEDYGNQLHSTYLNQYVQDVLGFSKLGLGSADALSGAGAVSSGSGSGTGNSKPGILPGMQQAAAKIAAAG